MYENFQIKLLKIMSKFYIVNPVKTGDQRSQVFDLEFLFYSCNKNGSNFK